MSKDSYVTLIHEGVDVFFNLCDGTPDDALSGIGLVQMMEKLAGHLQVQILLSLILPARK